MVASNKRNKNSRVAQSQHVAEAVNKPYEPFNPIVKTEASIRDSVSEMLSEVASMGNSITSAETVDASNRLRMQILKLKGLQRQLYARLHAQRSDFERILQQHETRSRNEAAERYERLYLENEIDKLKKYRMNFVINLATSEVDNDAPQSVAASEIENVTSTFLNEGCATNSFLDISDPDHKRQILDYLRVHLDKRRLLTGVLQQKKSDLLLMTKEVQNKRDFLNALPTHLDAIERASQSLTKFFTKASLNSLARNTTSAGQNAILMSGKDRLMRIESARRLSPPLYTLFSMLQHYIDNNVEPSEDENNVTKQSAQSKIAIKAIAPEKNQESNLFFRDQQQQVTLVLPVPEFANLSSAVVTVGAVSAKKVQIQFRYYSRLSVITVLATGCGTTLNQDVLLDELFPGDTSVAAEALIKAKWSMLQSNSSDSQSSLESDMYPTGVCYQWCNVLSGLYQVPSGDMGVEALVRNTRVVVIELIRRVRANAILKFCIQSFRKLNIPDIPLPFNSRMECCQRLHGWKIIHFVGMIPSEHGAGDDVTLHEVHFQKETSGFTANLHLHRARYPAIPPKWKISTKDDSLQLFNDQIAQIEVAVNDELLLLYQHDERYAEWIILFQINELVTRWENWLRDNAAPANCNTSIRKKRGRDHDRS